MHDVSQEAKLANHPCQHTLAPVSQLQQLREELDRQRSAAEEAQQQLEALASSRNEALQHAVAESATQRERLNTLSTQVQQLERTVQEQHLKLQHTERLQCRLQAMLEEQSLYGMWVLSTNDASQP